MQRSHRQLTGRVSRGRRTLCKVTCLVLLERTNRKHSGRTTLEVLTMSCICLKNGGVSRLCQHSIQSSQIPSHVPCKSSTDRATSVSASQLDRPHSVYLSTESKNCEVLYLGLGG